MKKQNGITLIALIITIVIPVGFAPVILEGSNSTTSLPGESGKVKNIMPAEEWKNITTEQINKGIVIVDHAITYTSDVPDFNEYVWVPITGSGKNNFDRTAWITLRTYDGNGNWISDNTTIRHPLAETSRENYWWEDKATIEYTNMVLSVARNKGFYIGRYEASNNGSNIAQSKRGQAVWNNIVQNNTSEIGAIQASANNPIANTHLMYGIEWDSTLNWLIGNATISSSTAGINKTMELADIQTNSCSWGNYKNSTGDATKAPYEKEKIQPSGASEYWKANNIYDLSGNVIEWTQEKYSTGMLRGYRGGFYSYNGHDFPAAFRGHRNENGTAYDQRLSLQFLFIALKQVK